MSEPLSGPIKAITGNRTLTTQYIVHFSAAFQFSAAVRRGRHVTCSEIAPRCFRITDEAILSRAIQKASMTKLAVVCAEPESAPAELIILKATQWWSAPCSGLVTTTRARHSPWMHEASESPKAAVVALEPPGSDSTCSHACCTRGERRSERSRKSQWCAVLASHLFLKMSYCN